MDIFAIRIRKKSSLFQNPANSSIYFGIEHGCCLVASCNGNKVMGHVVIMAHAIDGPLVHRIQMTFVGCYGKRAGRWFRE